jgi:hypothetical protein
MAGQRRIWINSLENWHFKMHDGTLSPKIPIIAEQANLSEDVVREALDRAAAAGTRIEQEDESHWKLIE